MTGFPIDVIERHSNLPKGGRGGNGVSVRPITDRTLTNGSVPQRSSRPEPRMTSHRELPFCGGFALWVFLQLYQANGPAVIQVSATRTLRDTLWRILPQEPSATS